MRDAVMIGYKLFSENSVQKQEKHGKTMFFLQETSNKNNIYNKFSFT